VGQLTTRIQAQDKLHQENLLEKIVEIEERYTRRHKIFDLNPTKPNPKLKPNPNPNPNANGGETRKRNLSCERRISIG